jgi:hypothetical protein
MWDMVDGNGGRVLYNWDLVCSCVQGERGLDAVVRLLDCIIYAKFDAQCALISSPRDGIGW